MSDSGDSTDKNRDEFTTDGNLFLFSILFFLIPVVVIGGVLYIPSDFLWLTILGYGAGVRIPRTFYSYPQKDKSSFLTRIAYLWYNSPGGNVLAVSIGMTVSSVVVSRIISNPAAAEDILIAGVLLEYIGISEIVDPTIRPGSWDRVYLLTVGIIILRLFESISRRWILVLDMIYWFLLGEGKLPTGGE